LDASNEEAARLRGRIHKIREETAQRDEIVRLYEEAPRARRSGDLDGALRSLQAILLMRPETKSAQQLLRKIETDIRERDQGVAHRLFRRSIPWIAMALVLAVAGLWTFPQIRSLLFPKPPGTAVEEHLRGGRYPEAEKAAELWTQREPQERRALDYYKRIMEIRPSLEAFESALQEKNFQKAKDANLRLENLNPVDPAGSIRRQKLSSVLSPDFIEDFLGGAR